MKITAFRHAAGCMLMAAMLALFACSSPQKKATATAQAFLQAYYTDLDFDKALQLSSDASHPAIIEKRDASTLNPYARQEAPALAFKSLAIDAKKKERATYTYTVDGVEKTLPLRQINKKWWVHVPQGTVESEGVEMIELQTGKHGGFAAAASGPIVYKKRKKN